MRRVAISTPEITLGGFLKWARAASSGGQARLLLETGSVTVNGVQEKRRGRRLRPGDVVRVGEAEELAVTLTDGR